MYIYFLLSFFSQPLKPLEIPFFFVRIAIFPPPLSSSSRALFRRCSQFFLSPLSPTTRSPTTLQLAGSNESLRFFLTYRECIERFSAPVSRNRGTGQERPCHGRRCRGSRVDAFRYYFLFFLMREFRFKIARGHRPVTRRVDYIFSKFRVVLGFIAELREAYHYRGEKGILRSFNRDVCTGAFKSSEHIFFLFLYEINLFVDFSEK